MEYLYIIHRIEIPTDLKAKQILHESHVAAVRAAGHGRVVSSTLSKHSISDSIKARLANAERLARENRKEPTVKSPGNYRWYERGWWIRQRTIELGRLGSLADSAVHQAEGEWRLRKANKK